jgi:hypothetical protein
MVESLEMKDDTDLNNPDMSAVTMIVCGGRRLGKEK